MHFQLIKYETPWSRTDGHIVALSGIEKKAWACGAPAFQFSTDRSSPETWSPRNHRACLSSDSFSVLDKLRWLRSSGREALRTAEEGELFRDPRSKGFPSVPPPTFAVLQRRY